MLYNFAMMKRAQVLILLGIASVYSIYLFFSTQSDDLNQTGLSKRLLFKSRPKFVKQFKTGSKTASLTDEIPEFLKQWKIRDVPESNYTFCWTKAVNQSEIPVWQIFDEGGLTFFLYGAYWDQREKGKEAVHIPLVRPIASYYDARNLNFFCHFWWGQNSVAAVHEAHFHELLECHANMSTAIITCPLSDTGDSVENNAVPLAVSITMENKATACNQLSNFLPIVYNPLGPGEEKQDFAVCHKALYFHKIDPSVLIIEWFEMQKLLGIKQVFMYEYFSHPNVSKILQHYMEEDGFVGWNKHIRIPFVASSSPEKVVHYLKDDHLAGWKLELIPYHDCFYRNMYHFKYIALLDVDEFFMPLQHDSLAPLVKELERQAAVENSSEPVVGFVFDNQVFLDSNDFQPELVPLDETVRRSHMLRHLVKYHSRKYSLNPKLLFNASEVIGLHNHWAQYSLHSDDRNSCRLFNVDPKLARNQHYCLNGAKKCRNLDGFEPNVDAAIWRFKDQLINNSLRVMKLLQFV